MGKSIRYGLVLAVMLLAACGGESAPPTPPVVVVVSATPVPTTPTPLLPTSTPTPLPLVGPGIAITVRNSADQNDLAERLQAAVPRRWLSREGTPAGLELLLQIETQSLPPCEYQGGLTRERMVVLALARLTQPDGSEVVPPLLLSGQEEPCAVVVVQGASSTDRDYFYPDEAVLAFTGWLSEAMEADPAVSNLLPALLLSHPGPLQLATFSPDGTLILSVSPGMMHLWDAAEGKLLRTFAQGTGLITSASFSPDGTSVLTCDAAGRSVTVWDTATGEQRLDLEANGQISWTTYSPDGRLILALDDTGRLFLWDAATGAQPAAWTESLTVTGAAFSPDSAHIATADGTNTITLWDLATGNPLKTFEGSARLILVRFSPDGRALLAGSQKGQMWLWDVASGAERLAMALSNGQVGSFLFSPDSRALLALIDDGAADWVYRAHVWSTESGALQFVQGQQLNVTSARFSPDGQTLLVIAGDRTVRVWDLTTGAERFVGEHGETVRTAEFSPDGGLVLTSSGDTLVRVWRLAE